MLNGTRAILGLFMFSAVVSTISVGYLLISKGIEWADWLFSMWSRLLFSQLEANSIIMTNLGPGYLLRLHAIPFVILFGAAFLIRSRWAAGLVIALFVINHLWTGLWSQAMAEKAFRDTELGKAYPQWPRSTILFCHETLKNDSLGPNDDNHSLEILRCSQSQLFTEAQSDEVCQRIFSAKRPFRNESEVSHCASRSKRLANVARWPQTFK